MRINWSTNAPSSTYVKYGLTVAYGNVARSTPAGDWVTHHAWFLSGLAPNTEYHYAACGSDGVETCSPDRTFRTSARAFGPHPADPELPRERVDTTMPVQTGGTLTVGPNCDDPVSGLVARWTQAKWGDTVVIPPGVVCTGSYSFPAKPPDAVFPHRYIVTRTGALDSQLPPDGTRITPVYAGVMPTIQANMPETSIGTLAEQAAYPCYAGSYYWVYDQPGFQMRQCVNALVGSIASTTGAGVSPIVVTVTRHGLTNSDIVYIKGVMGNTNANGSFGVTVVSASAVQLKYASWGSPAGNGNYTGGGTLYKNVWSEILAHNEGASVPATCAVGEWFFKTDAPQALDGVYRCVAPNQYAQIPVRRFIGYDKAAAIDLSSNAAHHLRFIGLTLTHVPLPPEPLWYQANGLQSGSLFSSVIHQGPNNHHIVWDRCWFHGQGYPSRIRLGGYFEGSHIAVINSYLDGFSVWQGAENNLLDLESGAIKIDRGPGPGKIHNNHIEAYGVSLFASDDWGAYTPPPADYEITRNTFYSSDAFRYGSSVSDGRTYMKRHLLELKRGFRWLIEGNTFDGTWACVNNAAAIMLSPRYGPGMMIQSISDGLVATYYKHYLQPGNRVVIYWSGNASHNGTWTVTSVLDDTHYRLGAMVGSSGGAFANLEDHNNTISDITIRNNVFVRVNGGIWALGHSDYGMTQGPVFSRLKIHNNLFQNIDYQRAIPNGSFPNGNGGTVLYAPWGGEDFQFTHNTVSGLTGTPDNVALAFEGLSMANPGEGFVARDNIFYYGTGMGAITMNGTYNGTAALDRAWQSGGRPDWVVTNNVIAKHGAPPPSPYPAKTIWHDLSTSPVPFRNPAAGDFTLTGKYTGPSKCFGVSGDCTTDGKDAGVNMRELQSAMGLAPSWGPGAWKR